MSQDYNARLRAHAEAVQRAHQTHPELARLQSEVHAAEDKARSAASRGSHSAFAAAQNHLADVSRRHALAIEAHVGPKPVHPNDLARAAGHAKPTGPKVLQRGKKGGQFYISESGAKVYAGKGKGKRK